MDIQGQHAAIRPDQESLNLPSVTLISLVERAYDVQDSVSGPVWLTTERYEVVAKAPQGTRGQLAAMLQNLLAERFHLRVHWETKEAQGYALVAGKSAHTLSPADPASPKSTTSSNSGRFVYSRVTLAVFASRLGRLMAQPVVDATGIKGEFNITLEAAPDSLPGLNARLQEAPSPYPSIFTALSQLGLNLEKRKLQVKTLIVDSADKVPTAN